VYERPPPEELPLVELECEVLLLEHRHGSAEVAAAAADAEELPDASSSEGTDEEVEGAAAVDASTTGMLQVNHSRLGVYSMYVLHTQQALHCLELGDV
jgi:hypothetical protein